MHKPIRQFEDIGASYHWQENVAPNYTLKSKAIFVVIQEVLRNKKTSAIAEVFFCGREGIRTPDPLGVNQVL